MSDPSPDFESLLRLAERRPDLSTLLSLALRSAGVGFWRRETATGRMRWDDGLHAMLGLGAGDPREGLEVWERLVTPEDEAEARAVVEGGPGAAAPTPLTFRLRRPSGEMRWLDGWIAAERDAEGATVATLGLMRDVTEARRLEASLEQVARIGAACALAADLTAEFNNMLGAALGAAELLAETARGDPAAAEHLAEVRRAVDRATGVTADLRAFAKRAPAAAAPLDVNAVVREMEGFLRHVLPSHVTLETALAGGLPAVVADRGGLENALLNLALNARDAMPEGGALTLETGEMRLDEAEAARLGGSAAAGRYVTLSVSDTGRGMDAEERRRAFEPFWSAGAGRVGVGLAAVDGVARRAGGGVSLRSEPGFGTVVRLFLRAAPESGAPRLSIARAAPSPRLLVAEDDAAMRRVLTAQLAGAGYEVLWAVDGEAALAAFEAEADLAAVVADLTLSGAIQGPELARRLRARRPELPVIFVTGRPETAVALGLGPDETVLRKPASRDALVAAVRAALAARD